MNTRVFWLVVEQPLVHYSYNLPCGGVEGDHKGVWLVVEQPLVHYSYNLPCGGVEGDHKSVLVGSGRRINGQTPHASYGGYFNTCQLLYANTVANNSKGTVFVRP